VVSGVSGAIVSRPLPKLLSINCTKDSKLKNVGAMRVSEATVKLDGSMTFSVTVPVAHGSELRLWTKGGPTEVARKAEAYATDMARSADGAVDYWGFVGSQHLAGRTVCFEYEGTHHGFCRMTGVQSMVESLTALAVRNNATGEFLTHTVLRRVASVYGVPVVNRKPELVGMTLAAAKQVVAQQEGYEGVVVSLAGSQQRYKLKTRWWEVRQGVGAGRSAARLCGVGLAEQKAWWGRRVNRREKRFARKSRSLQTRSQRVVFTGLPRRFPPAVLLSEEGVARVEACYNRATGRRGAVVVSFSDPADAERVLVGGARSSIWLNITKQARVVLAGAYIGRCSASETHRVVTHWPGGERRGCSSGGAHPGREGEPAPRGGDFQSSVWRAMLDEVWRLGSAIGSEGIDLALQRWQSVVGWDDRSKLREKVVGMIGGVSRVLQWEGDVVDQRLLQSDSMDERLAGDERVWEQVEAWGDPMEEESTPGRGGW
jgi:hypothetical protein